LSKGSRAEGSSRFLNGGVSDGVKSGTPEEREQQQEKGIQEKEAIRKAS